MMSIAKKYLKAPFTILLTVGAILILGLLSFGGFYALWPWISVSIAAMILSVLYEAEIYQKNINSALDKLLNKSFTAEILGEEFLKKFDWTQKDFPAFFKTYKTISERTISPAQQKRLKLMHIWLGHLIIQQKSSSYYARKTMAYLINNTDLAALQTRAKVLENHHRYIQIFSMITSFFMTLGTIFLILEVLPVLPFLTIAPALLPYILIPMAVISGIAYGFLTYNSLTDFLLKENLQTWWQEVKAQFLETNTSWKTRGLALFSAFIFVLNLTLTLCTAGTWWTVVNSSQTTWAWLKNPFTKFLTSMIPPVVSVSTLGFNLENTIETINEFKEALESPEPEHTTLGVSSHPETNAQLFNPFRILLKVTYTPLLCLLFLGHLIGIGLTADRMPGVPAILSTLLGAMSEGFEDFHYFFDLKKFLKPLAIFYKIIISPFVATGYLINLLKQDAHLRPSSQYIWTDLKHIFSEGIQEALAPEVSHENCSHEHHHEHSDIPNQVLQMVFTPLFALSALWHYGFQYPNIEQKKSFKECFYLQLGWNSQKNNNDYEHVQNTTDTSWLYTEASLLLQEHLDYLDEQMFAPEIAQEKKAKLSTLNDDLKLEIPIKKNIQELLKNPKINQQRFFKNQEKTATHEFLETLDKVLTKSNCLDCHGSKPMGKFLP